MNIITNINPINTQLSKLYSLKNINSINFCANSDAFIKSSEAQSVSNSSEVFDENRVKQIYDKTFELVAEQNPILQELNYTKPALVIDHEKDDALATYAISNNSISVSPMFNENMYIVYAKDQGGNFIPMGLEFDSTFKQNFAQLKATYGDIKSSKLTPKEKELYISCCFAHELRHSIQSHVCLSSASTKDEYKAAYRKNREELKEVSLKLLELNKELAQINPSEENKRQVEQCQKEIDEFDAKHDYSYVLGYEPKKILENDNVMKFSLAKDDNRFLSTKEHLAAAEKAAATDYCIRPVEIDAYNYQKEFLLKESMKDGNKDVRQDLILAILADIDLNEADVEKMIQAGFKPFVIVS